MHFRYAFLQILIKKKKNINIYIKLCPKYYYNNVVINIFVLLNLIKKVEYKMRKSKYLVLIGVLILILPAIINFVNFKDYSDTINSPEENQLDLEVDSKKPKSSGALDYFTLHIDDSGASGNGTWEWVKDNYAWCTWTGSEYILEDITLTNPDNLGNTLLIANSSVNFRIENCLSLIHI